MRYNSDFMPIEVALISGAAFSWHLSVDIQSLEGIMHPLNVRLPAAMIAALRVQAESQNLSFSAHVRSQLAAVLLQPADITKTAERATR